MEMAKPKLAKEVTIDVTQPDIDGAQCRRPTRCMIAVALRRILNMAHGYVHITTRGVFITRRSDYREKAFLPKLAARNLILFDDGKPVAPFKFKLEFLRGTPVVKVSSERRKQINRARAGKPRKAYDIKDRIQGVA